LPPFGAEPHLHQKWVIWRPLGAKPLRTKETRHFDPPPRHDGVVDLRAATNRERSQQGVRRHDVVRGAPRRRCRTRRSEQDSGVSVHRYYDPATEQFVSVDPLDTHTGSPYSYTGGDPVNRSDALGLCSTPTGDPNRPFAYTPGGCSQVQVQAIDKAAAAVANASCNSNAFSASFWTQGNCLSGLVGSPNGGGKETLTGVVKSVGELATASATAAATWEFAIVPGAVAFGTASAAGETAAASDIWSVTFPFDRIIVGATLGTSGVGLLGTELGGLKWLFDSLKSSSESSAMGKVTAGAGCG
jgi:RHS repeat-associated protein